MIRFFSKAVFSAFCLCSLFTGCKKEEIGALASNEKVSLRISVPIDETKVTSGMDEAAVWNYQVFLFDAEGDIEDYVSQSSDDIRLDCTLGRKSIVVFVNAPDLGYIMDYATLLTKKSLLSDNAEDALVMAGMTTTEVKSTQPDDITIQVTRKVAKIELASLTVEIDMPQHSGKSFKVSSVYLINVPAEMPYLEFATSTIWYNKMAYTAEDDNTLIYDDMGDFEVTAGTPYTTRNTFYCYANHSTSDTFSSTWSERNTRLVVEAKLGDEKYYYPVTLPRLDQNKKCEVNLKITRPGALTPDAVIDKFTAEFDVYIKDWQSGGTIYEEI